MSDTSIIDAVGTRARRAAEEGDEGSAVIETKRGSAREAELSRRPGRSRRIFAAIGAGAKGFLELAGAREAVFRFLAEAPHDDALEVLRDRAPAGSHARGERLGRLLDMGHERLGERLPRKHVRAREHEIH